MSWFPSWRIALRWLVASVLYYSGALCIHRWLKQRKYAIILNYHRVLDTSDQMVSVLPAMYVTPQTFEKHLRYLRRYYQVVPMDELMVWRERLGETRRPVCAITFDDGWSDNYDHALPLLRRYEIPATLFVATDFIESGRTPWFNRLGQILALLAEEPNDSSLMCHIIERYGLPTVLIRWCQSSPARRRQDIDAVIEAMKGLQNVELDSVVDGLQEALSSAGLPGNGDAGSMLTWRQIREMRAHNIRIGSHGLAHRILTRTPPPITETEVVESRRIIEEQVQETVVGFSYPNGDHSDDVESVVRAAGYGYACTILPGYVTPHDNPYRLKRILVHEATTFSTALFACHIARVLSRDR